MKNIATATKLVGEAKKKLVVQRESRKNAKFKGVTNVSNSDLENVIFYGESIIRCGSYRAAGLMHPYGNTRDILSNAGLLEV